MDDEFGGAAGPNEPASLKAELWSDEDSSGEEPEDEEFGALHAAGAGAKDAQICIAHSASLYACQPGVVSFWRGVARPAPCWQACQRPRGTCMTQSSRHDLPGASCRASPFLAMRQGCWISCMVPA